MSIQKIRSISVRIQRVASAIATIAFAVLFLLFIYGIAMRYIFDRPPTWIDETVTILATWIVFWSSAFVLRWSDFIAFDVVYRAVPPNIARWMIVVGSSFFVIVFGATIYKILDYVLFLKIATTDMLQIRLDYIYSIFIVFLIALMLRLSWLIFEMLSPGWSAALESLNGEEHEVQS